MDDMHKDFEAWYESAEVEAGFLGDFYEPDEEFPLGGYANYEINNMWLGYQAGRASAALQALSDIGQEQQPECYRAGCKMVPIKMPEKAYGTIGRAASGHWRPNDAGNAEKFWDAMISAAPDQEGG